MKKKVKDLTSPLIYDERCGDCYYNEEGCCKRNPDTCVYNQPPKINKEEEEKE